MRCWYPFCSSNSQFMEYSADPLVIYGQFKIGSIFCSIFERIQCQVGCHSQAGFIALVIMPLYDQLDIIFREQVEQGQNLFVDGIGGAGEPVPEEIQVGDHDGIAI